MPPPNLAILSLESAVRAGLARPGANVEYRLVVAESRDSIAPRGAVRDSITHAWLTISDTVVMNLHGVDSMELRFGDAGALVGFLPPLKSAQRLVTATTGRPGRRMAILLNGQLLVAPSIRRPWVGHVAVVSGIDSALASQLYQRLDQSLPQGPGPR